MLILNYVGLQQIRASAQASIDSALDRAQSALNEGVATRLDALRLETELEDLQVDIEDMRAIVKQRNSASTMGGK